MDSVCPALRLSSHDVSGCTRRSERRSRRYDDVTLGPANLHHHRRPEPSVAACTCAIEAATPRITNHAAGSNDQLPWCLAIELPIAVMIGEAHANAISPPIHARRPLTPSPSWSSAWQPLDSVGAIRRPGLVAPGPLWRSCPRAPPTVRRRSALDRWAPAAAG